ncbi:uncharacterized protein SCHCODRAFT_02733964 [Schizophyllum commune H4-8]|uniref:Uncharacterized protein n=1 Tax=Schizophyllum commune (strain H4-8 / FGSC 9210) TaxID=578458 RepID=D8Q441_SCHCM|nr:uncharacterized protein SCHCODRAFT_02733964 [Schizophyllum commune H4-8]KAI5892769.1 hypothetical protein SCHCODRAFT_02733964 [Schizophyllum commune H4-8]
MLESATRRKRKRSITVEPSCIFDTSPTSEDVEGKNDTSVAVEDEDGPLVDELASPKDSDPLTIEAFLQRSSAARTKTYRGKRKRRRVHFAESDHDYAPSEDDAGEAEDQLCLAADDQPDNDDEPLALLASSPPRCPATAPPRKRKTSLSHRLTIAALECGGTVPVEPELPTTPPRIPLTFVAANGTTKPPKRPRKTGHLVDPRRRAGFGRSISHFRAAAAQRAVNAASPSRPAPASSSTAAPRSNYRAKWRTHAPPMLPKAYLPTCAADSILPPLGKKPHRRQPAQLSATVPLKLVPLEESVVGAKAKTATGRPGRRMARKKDAVLTGPGPLTFVSVLTKKVPQASSSLLHTSRASSPAPTFCMTSVRDRLLGSRQPPIAADTENVTEEIQDHNRTTISDSVDAQNSFYADRSSPLSSNAASKAVSTPTSKNALASTAKHARSSFSELAPFSAFKTPFSINTKTPVTSHVNATRPCTAQTTLPSSTKPLKPLAAFHDRLAETVRTASQLVDAATGALRTPESGPRRRKRASEVSGRKAARQDSLVPASYNVYAGAVCSTSGCLWCSSFDCVAPAAYRDSFAKSHSSALLSCIPSLWLSSSFARISN